MCALSVRSICESCCVNSQTANTWLTRDRIGCIKIMRLSNFVGPSLLGAELRQPRWLHRFVSRGCWTSSNKSCRLSAWPYASRRALYIYISVWFAHVTLVLRTSHTHSVVHTLFLVPCSWPCRWCLDHTRTPPALYVAWKKNLLLFHRFTVS